jgi:hypothetical protein
MATISWACVLGLPRVPGRCAGTSGEFVLDSWEQFVLCFLMSNERRVHSMGKIPPPRIICLSSIYDQHYHDLRGEKVEHILTTPFRQTLLRG